MGSREDRIAQEQMERWALEGRTPDALPELPGYVPPADLPEPEPEHGLVEETYPATTPIPDGYIGLRNGSHGSATLDEDADKLAAMGFDPGPTLQDVGLSPEDVAAVVDQAETVPDPDMTEDVVMVVGDNSMDAALALPDEPAAAPDPQPGAWLISFDGVLFRLGAIDDDVFEGDTYTAAVAKRGYEWQVKPAAFFRGNVVEIVHPEDRALHQAVLAHLESQAAIEKANEASARSDSLLRLHFALAEAATAADEIGWDVRAAPTNA